MSDDSQLLNEIAALAGAINRHKNSQQGYVPPPPSSRIYKPGRSRWVAPGSNTWTASNVKTNKRPPSVPAQALNRPTSTSTPVTPSPTTTTTTTKYPPQNRYKQQRSINKPCIHFTRTGNCFNSFLIAKKQSANAGTCSHGLSCPYNHDSNHVAICKPFLKGKCSRPDCSLSHNPTAHNSPLCIHYIHGNCNRNNCKYSHQDVLPDANICRAFALNGYCEVGAPCKQRHIFECPDFEATGSCPRPNCQLAHVLRAKKEQPIVEQPSSGSNSKEPVHPGEPAQALFVADGDLESSDKEDRQQEDVEDFQTRYNSRATEKEEQDSLDGQDYITL